MGYTHYWDYKNPVVEMTQNKLKKDAIRDSNRGNWELIQKEWDKLPSDDSYLKRMEKHTKAFKNISKELNVALNELRHLGIRGGMGVGEPEISEYRIWFNGDAKNDEDHETFVLRLFDMECYRSQQEIAENGVFGFCKTARKPYDLMVCVSLMVIQHHLGADFSVSSDGNQSEWQTAIDFYEKLYSRKAPRKIMNYFKRVEQAIA